LDELCGCMQPKHRDHWNGPVTSRDALFELGRKQPPRLLSVDLRGNALAGNGALKTMLKDNI
jgi:hypothetical protein